MGKKKKEDRGAVEVSALRCAIPTTCPASVLQTQHRKAYLGFSLDEPEMYTIQKLRAENKCPVRALQASLKCLTNQQAPCDLSSVPPAHELLEIAERLYFVATFSFVSAERAAEARVTAKNVFLYIFDTHHKAQQHRRSRSYKGTEIVTQTAAIWLCHLVCEMHGFTEFAYFYLKHAPDVRRWNNTLPFGLRGNEHVLFPLTARKHDGDRHYIDTKSMLALRTACLACGKPAKLVCGRCECARFCNRTCLKMSWTEHKSQCGLIVKMAQMYEKMQCWSVAERSAIGRYGLFEHMST